MALTMVFALAACGGSGTASDPDAVTITIFNSKMEIQSQMEEMAAKYSEEKGVNVEVYYSNDTVAAHMATRYASNEPYTISMVDAKDIYSLAVDHGIDLSGEPWVENTTQAISVDGKVLGFPVCVEARGIIYNADAIKNVTGKDFDPATIKTTEDFPGDCGRADCRRHGEPHRRDEGRLVSGRPLPVGSLRAAGRPRWLCLCPEGWLRLPD